jgi:hypothetical protein
MPFWELAYNGTTKAVADWGAGQLVRERKHTTTDTVTFKLDGTLIDTNPLPFPCLLGQQVANTIPWLTITRNGVRWFSGIVTKPKGNATGAAESIDYEISGPWLFLEKTPFQQQWVTTDIAGGALVTLTTTRSSILSGQSLDGTKMNSGQVLKEVLLYAQYAYQMLPFPTAVGVDHLPAAPPANGPFLIGTIAPTITVPYKQLRDRSCADIIREVLKYCPDCVAWFDYSTTPWPTLHIDTRSNLAANLGPGGSARTIKAFPNFESDSYGVSGFSPTPRRDVQVPVVVLKFEQKNSIDGATYDACVVQSYPPAPAGVDQGAWESQPFAWVQTIDLVGGHTTQQSADIKSILRPITPGDEIASTWCISKLPWLTDGTQGTFDIANISVGLVQTTIDANDPLNDPDDNPNNISLPNCPQLVFELLTSAFPDWLQDDPNNLDAAKVSVYFTLKYTGADAKTKAIFWKNLSDLTTPLTDGTGVIEGWFNFRATNAATNTYSELTSWAASEPIPPGMAQALYESLSQPHYAGTMTVIEEECSDLLPMGCIFNTVDGNPDWQTMNALVISVREGIDLGETSVEFGPPLFLDAEEMEELFRAQWGRQPTYKLDQRMSGKLTAGSNVIGNKHSHDSHHTPPPALPTSSAQVGPFTITYGANPDGSTYWVQVDLNGIFLDQTGAEITVTGLGTKMNLDGDDTLWLDGDVSGLAYTEIDLCSYGNGNTTLTNPNTYWTDGGLTEDDGDTPPSQTHFRKVIAEFEAGSSGQPVLKTRQTTTNLQLFLVPIGQEIALYPYPI